ncbi:hypothetical protein I352_02430 [Cryptococcus deuterogattii MMRL2647]|nr:hypothetical protein I352_02430 [Cryptococcus deuterogattii MMRL2647]
MSKKRANHQRKKPPAKAPKWTLKAHKRVFDFRSNQRLGSSSSITNPFCIAVVKLHLAENTRAYSRGGEGIVNPR